MARRTVRAVAACCLGACATAAAAAAAPPPDATQWSCSPLSSASLAPGVSWSRLSCTSPSVPYLGPAWPTLTAPHGPVVVNLVSADLTRPGVRMVPVVANQSASPPLAPVNAMAAADPRRAQLLAGINGGYFWRVDVSTFVDGVCTGKTRADAEAPPSQAAPNAGVGDGVTVVGGSWLSSNCNSSGFNRPAVLTINGSASTIGLVPQAAPPPSGTALDALGAGPLLLATNASGITRVAVPPDDNNVGNILEYSGATGVGLTPNGTALLVTVDGYDGCPAGNTTCGTNEFQLAYLLRDAFGASSAMSMDQGGSTTMYVVGQGPPGAGGVVTNPGSAPRPVFNALFVLSE